MSPDGKTIAFTNEDKTSLWRLRDEVERKAGGGGK